MRPPIEGLMEKLKPKYLSGKIKFRGLIRVKQRMVLRAIGINFKRYARRISKKILDFIKKIGNILLTPFKYQETNCIFAGGSYYKNSTVT